MARRTLAGDFDYEGDLDYSGYRRPDPRIAAAIAQRLGTARTVVNVGAGTGSYEPEDRHVTPVEPSRTMRSRRPSRLAPAVDGVASRLPFDDDSFDAGMAVLTIHHWPDLAEGLAELRRVVRDAVVIVTFDPDALGELWLADYFPEVIALEQRRFPTIHRISDALGGVVETSRVAVGSDCPDGFGEAYYARPEALLDPRARAAQSGFGLADPGAVERGVERLAADLASGAWDRRHGHLRELAEHVGAVRIVTARP